MKKLLYSTLAIAAVLAASCSQEISKNNSNELALLTGKHEVVYKGLASNVTKTAYADDKTFSWEAGEVVYVVTGPQSDESEDQYLHGSVFTGDVAGTVTNFKGEVADGQEAYLALYPSFGRLFVNNYIAAYLPPTTFVDLDDDTYYTVKSTNPLSNLPLIGVPDDANEVLQALAVVVGGVDMDAHLTGGVDSASGMPDGPDTVLKFGHLLISQHGRGQTDTPCAFPAGQAVVSPDFPLSMYQRIVEKAPRFALLILQRPGVIGSPEMFRLRAKERSQGFRRFFTGQPGEGQFHAERLIFNADFRHAVFLSTRKERSGILPLTALPSLLRLSALFCPLFRFVRVDFPPAFGCLIAGTPQRQT